MRAAPALVLALVSCAGGTPPDAPVEDRAAIAAEHARLDRERAEWAERRFAIDRELLTKQAELSDARTKLASIESRERAVETREAAVAQREEKIFGWEQWVAKPRDEQRRDYAERLLRLSDPRRTTMLDDAYVTGEIKNVGPRTLDRVTLLMHYLDGDGKPVWEERLNAVNIRSVSMDADGYTPLRPNYARTITFKMADPPGFAGQVKWRVLDLDFEKPSR